MRIWTFKSSSRCTGNQSIIRAAVAEATADVKQTEVEAETANATEVESEAT